MADKVIKTAEELENVELPEGEQKPDEGIAMWQKAIREFQQQPIMGLGVQPTQTTPEVARVFGEGRGATAGEAGLGFLSRLTDLGTNFASAFGEAKAKQLEALKQRDIFTDPYKDRKDKEFNDKVFKDVVTRFNDDPIVKTWKESVTAYNQVVALSEQNTAAAANALVTKFMKVIDPPSIVRDTEVKMGKESAGFVQGLINKINELQGKGVTEQTKKGYVEAAKALAEEVKKLYNNTETRYVTEAKARGLNDTLTNLIPLSLSMTQTKKEKGKTNTSPENVDYDSMSDEELIKIYNEMK